MTVKIAGTGSYLPGNIVTNDYLSKIVDTNDEWIRSRTGIEQRRVSNKEGTAYMAAKAATAALENAQMDAEELDQIIVATMTADYSMPNTACEVQTEIGAVNATCFDLNAACTGFIYALNTAYAYIQCGMKETIMVIGAEVLSRQIDWTDRGTCVLFGDGAGAVILKRSSGTGGILEWITGSDGRKKDVLMCKERTLLNPFVKGSKEENYIKMDGQEVFRFAVKVVPRCIQELLEKAQMEAGQIKYYLLHQANKRILDSVAKRLNLNLDAFPMNLDKYGNTSAASIPILLDEMNQQKLLKEKDYIILAGFGGGLTWGAVLIQW